MPERGGREFQRVRRAPRRWRTALAALAVFAVPAAAVSGSTPTAAAQDPSLRVFVLVTDGLGPEEVTTSTMPNLTRLKSEGTWYEQARAVLVAETLPNHVGMATGVVPARNGIVANSAFDPRDPDAGDVELSDPSMVTATTTVTQLERQCPEVSTATIMSKTYLYDVFRGSDRNQEADLHWNAEPLYIPESNHTLDQLSMERLRRWAFVEQPDAPQYAFVNLGDIDRSGHIDPTGSATDGEYPAGRRGAMLDTDVLIGEFVQALKLRGWWDESVLFIASDHGMDFSAPEDYVDLREPLEAAGLRVGLDPATDDVGLSENGGAALVYVHDDSKEQQVLQLLSQVDGVDRILTRADGEYERYGLDHPRSGDLLVLVQEGYRVASGDFGASNPLPGNHGHSVTQHSVLLVAGGHEAIRQGISVDGPTVYRAGEPPRVPDAGPGNLSLAPTTAALFGLREPNGGYDGPLLAAALADGSRGLGVCGQSVDAGGDEAAANDADAAEQATAPNADRGGQLALPATGAGVGGALVALTFGLVVLSGVRRRY